MGASDLKDKTSDSPPPLAAFLSAEKTFRRIGRVPFLSLKADLRQMLKTPDQENLYSIALAIAFNSFIPPEDPADPLTVGPVPAVETQRHALAHLSPIEWLEAVQELSKRYSHAAIGLAKGLLKDKMAESHVTGAPSGSIAGEIARTAALIEQRADMLYPVLMRRRPSLASELR